MTFAKATAQKGVFMAKFQNNGSEERTHGRSRFHNHEYEKLIRREHALYETASDTRDPFFRDYTRILHSNAYRRLKHKTQVFFNIGNDHVCTRMEHVAHVEAVSHSIALGLGLDLELTRAIASGHDLGHSPFGHEGEIVLGDLMREHLSKECREQLCGERAEKQQAGKSEETDKQVTGQAKTAKLFWHERNGLRFVDKIELLPDLKGVEKNLCLTYAVRDGIISHCGEVNENGLIPRDEDFDLDRFQIPGQYMPYTWEGCVVKISDKIAYLGRDIEDAITLNFLSAEAQAELKKLGDEYAGEGAINTTSIMHGMIGDICSCSTPETGICLGPRNLEFFDRIKDFNTRHIYRNAKFNVYKEYVKLVIRSIFDVLYAAYCKDDTIRRLRDVELQTYPKLAGTFIGWLCKYASPDLVRRSLDANTAPDIGIIPALDRTDNDKIYGELATSDIYAQSIIDFISGMTDPFAISLFEELISYG